MEKEQHKHKHKHKHRKNKGKIIKIILVVVLVAILSVGIIVYGVYRNIEKTYTNSYVPVSTPSKHVEISNVNSLSILVLETKTVNNKQENLATAIAVMNKKSKKMDLLNIPVGAQLPKTQKLTASFDKGGVSSVMADTQTLLDIPVSNYLQVDIGTIGQTVEAVDGITVDNPVAFSQSTYQFAKGNILLSNAKQVEAYLSGTPELTDDSASNRVLKVSLGIYKKIKSSISINSVSNLSYYQNVYNSLIDSVKTNISFSDLQKIALDYNEAFMNSTKINFTPVKTDGKVAIKQNDVENIRQKLALILN